MSVELTKAFYERLEKDEALTAQYKMLLGEMADEQTDETQALDKIVHFAAQNGYEISADDIKQVAGDSSRGAISDERLNVVSAGDLSVGFISTTNNGDRVTCVVLGFS